MNQVGRYQILEELGRGAMGVVYKALDPAIGRTVAIKTIRLLDLTDPDERRRVRERLLREAQSAGVLSHPNIVTIYDVLEKEDFAYIFMEYVSGASLEKMLRARSLPDSASLMHFLRQVAGALDYAHRKGIVHRDIKPANIIISEGATGAERLAKIADFGVAKFVSQEMTHSGTMIGTPNYMSPEQIEGAPVEGRSDQFSLAVVVYELLTGARPFGGDSLPALFYAICRQEPKAIEQANGTLTAKVGLVLQRALSKDPAQRFAFCIDFIGSLSTALAECPDWLPVNESAVAREANALAETAGGIRQASAELPLSRKLNGGSGNAFEEPVRTSAVGIVSGPVGGAPVPKSYEMPTRLRRRRGEDLEEDESGPSGSIGKKLGLILAMIFAIAAAIVFIVRWNSGPTVPVQTLDANSGATTAPPAGDITAPKGEAKPPAQNAGSGTGAAPTTPSKITPASNKAEDRFQVPPAGAPAPNHEAAAAVDDVEMLTEPPGAKLVVDDRPDLSCQSPCTLSLPAGRHTLAAELNGYNLAHRIFSVPSDSDLFIPLSKSTGTLLVTSSPSGAIVLVDGKQYGKTPQTLHLPAGVHQLAFISGSMRHDETVVVTADTLGSASFQFQ